ncbi:MAG: type II toxin-antitoxin system antitoxin SocA domain-containing protein [Bacillota bacterium]
MSQVLQQLRKEKGASQEDMAGLIGVSRPTYLEIEKGRKELGVQQAKKLAAYFQISFTDFLNDKIVAESVIIRGKEASPKRPEIRISVPEKNLPKFKEVLIYVLNRIGAKPNVGDAVLCKLLYFIDFDYYERYEKQLSGSVYIKNHFGPTPAGFPQIIEEMEKRGEIVTALEKYYKREQRKRLPLRSADLSLISAQEMKHIDWVLDRLSDKNATEMREYSHHDVPWLTAEDQKPIDYESVFYRTPDYSVRSYD